MAGKRAQVAGLSLAVCALIALGSMALGAPTADALSDDWTCHSYSSAQTCWAGTGYRGYSQVLAEIAVVRAQVCAKGHTAAGNTRTGAGDGCSYNNLSRISCFGGPSPSSAAYVYWAGSGSAINIRGNARSPSEPLGC